MTKILYYVTLAPNEIYLKEAKMKVYLVSTTHSESIVDNNGQEKLSELSDVDFDIIKQRFLQNAGHSAGICYMKASYDGIINESLDKTMKRASQTITSGHHSVYDHDKISLYLEDIPKALAMVLNNEKYYDTSEKSARYTQMHLDGREQALYNKWVDIYRQLIIDEYQSKYPEFFTNTRVTKLAQENARYLISVYTPTSMRYTTSYRQLNYIYGFMQSVVSQDSNNKFYKPIIPAMRNLMKALKQVIEPTLTDTQKYRHFSLLNNSPYEITQYYGDVYATHYNGSLAQLAQAQRHRTIDYSFKLLETDEYYVPPILRGRKELIEEWLSDCYKSSSATPQGTLVDIQERGNLDTFIEKMKERECSYAQLEINQQTTKTNKEYYQALVKQNHPRAQELKEYQKGARCTFPTYECNSPCKFSEGINLTRRI